MTDLFRLVCLTALLMSAIAIPTAADQGRGDHDTPATQRQSEFGSPQQYSARACRTDDHGWVVCRDRSGRWQREETQRCYRGFSGPDRIDNWLWRLLH
jgi:hypothetical protein